MPLSEHEQRILDEIERRLAEEDPKFARSTIKATPRGVAVARIKRGVFGFALGLALLFAGLIVGGTMFLPMGLGSFALMLASVSYMARAAKDAATAHPSDTDKRGGWLDRFEDRWRKRTERGDDV